MSTIKEDKEREVAEAAEFDLLASSEVSDLGALSPEVQAVARRFNAEFLALLADSESSEGRAIVQRLLPTVVSVLEQLEDFYGDHSAYKLEAIELRDKNVQLVAQLNKAKAARHETEEFLARIEDQYEAERRTLNEALAQNETQIRRLEMKLKNANEQLARMEHKEAETSKENAKLHERINELLRSQAEMNDTLKHTVSHATSTPSKIPGTRSPGNAFDTTSSGEGFDELSAMDGEFSPTVDDDLPDETSLTAGPNSDSDPFNDCGEPLSGIRKEVEKLIQENRELMDTKNALNVVKDDLLAQRDSLKAEYEMLQKAFEELANKRNQLQQDLCQSDQSLSAARAEIEELKATVESQKRELKSQGGGAKGFTKSEMARLIRDRNYYKERFLELRDAIRLMETLRASQRGHPELLSDLPPGVTDVQLHPPQHASPQHQLKHVFARLMNLVALPRWEVGFDPMSIPEGDSLETKSSAAGEVATNRQPTTVSEAKPTQRWIKIYQSSATAPVFGWVRGFGRVRQGKAETLSTTTATAAAAFNPVNHPVPKKCRGIGRSTLRIELTAALSVPSPMGDECTQHLWLIGRGASSTVGGGTPQKSRNVVVGKLYIFDPLQLNDPLVSMDLLHDFLPISAALFSIPHEGDSEPLAGSGRFIVKQFRSLQSAETPAAPLSNHRVLIAASDGRFLVCATARNPDAISKDDAWKVVLLSTFRLANPGESAMHIVSLGHRICLGVLNSTGSNQFVTLKWHRDFDSAANSAAQPINDVELNRLLRATALSLPTSGGGGQPSGPLLLSPIFARAFCCLGTAGGGALHRFDINSDTFVGHLALPSQTPCLHAIAVSSDESEAQSATTETGRRLVWLAVSGISPPTPTLHPRPSGGSEEDGGGCSGANEGVYLGPLSRLLSVCAEKHVFVHNIDLTSVLASMIDTTGVVDPVDLTVSRLFVQGSECIWFATRCGLIGRFLVAFLLNSKATGHDGALGSPTEVLNQDAILLSCHAYRRPVSALIAIKSYEETTEKGSASANQGAFLMVAVGHDYTYLQTSTPASRSAVPKSPLITAVNQRFHSSPGAHAIVWTVSV